LATSCPAISRAELRTGTPMPVPVPTIGNGLATLFAVDQSLGLGRY
jgi:hypothetical protein